MSYRHPVTALPNHTLFGIHLQTEIEKSATAGAGLAVFTIGIQGLTALEKTVDRQTVDQVLEYLSHVIQRTLRHTDIVGHEGDHCFFVLVGGIKEHKVEQVGREVGLRLVELLTGPAPVDHGKSHQVRVSAGMAGFPSDGHSATELLVRSAEAANCAKNNSVSRFCTHQEVFENAVSES